MVTISTTQLAEVFGVTDRAVRLWVEKGCPKAGRGKWNLSEVLPWWLENIYKAEEDTEALAEAKLEYWQAKGRVEKVKADVAEKSVMKIEDFKDAWAWRVSEMSNGLGAIPLRVASLLVGKSEKEIKAILENEVWKIREKFSREGRFTPVPKAKKPTGGKKRKAK
jgi:phage terminase Nu1 subunit (DNA packaging protein)